MMVIFRSILPPTIHTTNKKWRPQSSKPKLNNEAQLEPYWRQFYYEYGCAQFLRR